MRPPRKLVGKERRPWNCLWACMRMSLVMQKPR